jgi:hypothetical protein
VLWLVAHVVGEPNKTMAGKAITFLNPLNLNQLIEK